MRDAIEIVFSSTLATSREVVWHWVSATDGVSSELFPLVRMTHPRDQRSLGEAAVVPGQVVFGSWLLLFGVLPFDRHALALGEVVDGCGFVEGSTSWLQRRWPTSARSPIGSTGGA